MKPIRLDFEAFGAFPGRESIDFAALAPRGLFLVSGATGTGKTTIFDALCWALYGEMPTKDGAEVRSDHVADEVRTQVTFVFEVGGERYRVTRNPDQLRPARGGRSGHAREPASALLERETPDGLETVAHKKAAVDAACQELLGLDATQFQRVVLLPQGEFAEFLRAGTAERAKVLSRLFGGAVYHRVVDHLKAHRKQVVAEADKRSVQLDGHLDEAYTHLRGAIVQLAETGTVGSSAEVADPFPREQPDTPQDAPGERNDDADPFPREQPSWAEPPPPTRNEDVDRDALAGALAFLDVWLADLAGQVEARHRDAQAATARFDDAKAADRRFTDAETHRATLDALAAAAPQVESDRLAAERSRTARPVVEVATRATALQGQLDAAESARDAAWAELSPLLAAVDIATTDAEPHVLADLVARRRTDNDEARRRLAAVTTAREALTTAEELEAAAIRSVGVTEAGITESTQRHTTLTGQRTQAAQIAAGAEDARVAYEAADPLLAARRRLDELTPRVAAAHDAFTRADRAYNRTFDRFVATQAPRLAAGLVDGEACPVCGSPDHPDPATDADGEPVDFAAVDTAITARTARQGEWQELRARQTETRQRLADAVEYTVAELEERVRTTRTAYEEAKTARLAVTRLDTELAECRAETSRLTERLTNQREAARKAAAAVVDAREHLGAARAELGDLTDADVGAATEVLDRLAPLLTAHRAAHTDVGRLGGTVTEVAGQVADALAVSGFADVDAARAVAMEPDAERAAHKRAADHVAARNSAEGALRVLQDQGIPAERPDLERLGDAARAAHDRWDAHQRRLTRAGTLRSSAAGALERFDTGAEAFAELAGRVAVAKRAANVCAEGGSASRIPLPMWVLARELDRITAAANVHLVEMTAGRYTLSRVAPGKRGNTRVDLDLQVTDSQTGRTRSTASLSGGEQFQASLALALGLADVVSHGGTATGNTFEALFVDEGFGSLDRDALDTAVEALTRLQRTGRMVGAITHVESMKEDLHVGIHVRRRDDGVGSTLTVTP